MFENCVGNFEERGSGGRGASWNVNIWKSADPENSMTCYLRAMHWFPGIVLHLLWRPKAISNCAFFRTFHCNHIIVILQCIELYIKAPSSAVIPLPTILTWSFNELDCNSTVMENIGNYPSVPSSVWPLCPVAGRKHFIVWETSQAMAPVSFEWISVICQLLRPRVAANIWWGVCRQATGSRKGIKPGTWGLAKMIKVPLFCTLY